VLYHITSGERWKVVELKDGRKQWRRQKRADEE
jgi:hypothetical protein